MSSSSNSISRERRPPWICAPPLEKVLGIRTAVARLTGCDVVDRHVVRRRTSCTIWRRTVALWPMRSSPSRFSRANARSGRSNSPSPWFVASSADRRKSRRSRCAGVSACSIRDENASRSVGVQDEILEKPRRGRRADGLLVDGRRAIDRERQARPILHDGSIHRPGILTRLSKRTCRGEGIPGVQRFVAHARAQVAAPAVTTRLRADFNHRSTTRAVRRRIVPKSGCSESVYRAGGCRRETHRRGSPRPFRRGRRAGQRARQDPQATPQSHLASGRS